MSNPWQVLPFNRGSIIRHKTHYTCCGFDASFWWLSTSATSRYFNHTCVNIYGLKKHVYLLRQVHFFVTRFFNWKVGCILIFWFASMCTSLPVYMVVYSSVCNKNTNSHKINKYVSILLINWFQISLMITRKHCHLKWKLQTRN